MTSKGETDIIYKIFIIDSENGISILETTFKEFKKDKISNEVIPGFFKEINLIIDKIQEAMAKGRRKEEMTRVIESENSTIIIYFHGISRILFCIIADADDDIDKLVDVVKKIATRFYKKHQSDIDEFRTTTEKGRFQSITADIENLTNGGKIAQIFPKLLVVKNVLEKIYSMGMINEEDLEIAINCSGENSPLMIARATERTRNQVNEILRKLEQLDIITY